ncbi:MAG: hypothetical protein ACFE7E_08410 [Candidatus Hodarchaeota archaeon]
MWLEGDDDERLFVSIIKPKLLNNYDHVDIIKYAKLSKRFIKQYVRSIGSMKAKYILLSDLNDSPCVTQKKERILECYSFLDKDRIQIVVKEIESWYIAGLNKNTSEVLGIKNINNTEQITKEQFHALMPQGFVKVDFMKEILKMFSIDVAKRKNRSFEYFSRKHID